MDLQITISLPGVRIFCKFPCIISILFYKDWICPTARHYYCRNTIVQVTKHLSRGIIKAIKKTFNFLQIGIFETFHIDWFLLLKLKFHYLSKYLQRSVYFSHVKVCFGTLKIIIEIRQNCRNIILFFVIFVFCSSLLSKF